MKKYICEFVGTMFLTLFACGVAIILGCNTVAGVIGTSFAFGLVLILACYSIGNVSGCHINPAVSISMLVSGKMKACECVKYIVFQVLGALFGSLILALLLGNFEVLGANGFGNNIGNGTVVTALIAFVVEVILTFVFTLTIHGVTDKKENNQVSGIVIGLTLVLVHLFGIPFTGTSVNPARSLAPALLQGGTALSQVWVFILAPLVGGILGGLFYKFVLKTEKK